MNFSVVDNGTCFKMALAGRPAVCERFIELQYNSTNTNAGSFGPGWSLSADFRLHFSPDHVNLFCGTKIADRFTLKEFDTALAGDQAMWFLTRKKKAWIVFDSLGTKIRFPDTLRHGETGCPDGITSGSGGVYTPDYAADRLVSLHDHLKNRLEFEYRLGKVTGITYLAGDGKVFDRLLLNYDLHGDLVELVFDSGKHVWFAYKNHLMIGCEAAGRFSRRAAYDTLKRCVAIWDNHSGEFRDIGYDDARQTVKVANNPGEITLYRRVTDMTGRTIVLEKIPPTGAGQTFIHDENLNCIGFFDSAGHLVSLQQRQPQTGSAKLISAQDVVQKLERRDGRLEIYEAGLGLRSVQHNKGNVHRIEFEDGSAWNIERNSAGWPTQVTSPAGRIVDFLWSSDYRKVTAKDLRGREKTITLNTWLQPVREENQGTIRSSTRHNGAGEIIATASDVGIFQVLRDRWGHIAGFVDAAGKKCTIHRDKTGNIVSISKRDGSGIHFSYDAAGRMVRMTAPSQEITFVANARNGSRQTICSGEEPITVARRDEERVVSCGDQEEVFLLSMEALPKRRTFFDGSQHTIRFDANLEPVSTSTPFVRTAVVNDAKGFQQAVFVGPAERTFTRGPDGFILEIQYNGTHTQQFEVNEAGEPVKATIKEGDAATDFDLGYDPAGRLKRVNGPAGYRATFRYGKLDQLRNVEIRTASGQTYQCHHYTSANRTPTGFVVDRGHGLQIAFDTGNRISAFRTKTRSLVLERDKRGNMIGDSEGRTFRWDSHGRLTDADEMHLEYDARGRRIAERGGALNRRYEFDETTGLLSVTDSSEKTLFFRMDALGRWVRKWQDDEAHAVHWYYDRERWLGALTENQPSAFCEVAGTRLAWSSAGRVWTLVEGFYGNPIQYQRVDDGETTRILWTDPYGSFEYHGPDRPPVLYNGWLWDPELNLYLTPGNLYDPKTRTFLWPDARLRMHGYNAYAFEPGIQYRYEQAQRLLHSIENSAPLEVQGLPDARLMPMFDFGAWKSLLGRGIPGNKPLNTTALDPGKDLFILEPYEAAVFAETPTLRRSMEKQREWSNLRVLTSGFNEQDLLRMALL